MHTYAPAYARTHMHTCSHTPHIYMHTTHTYLHTHTCTHTYTHTHTYNPPHIHVYPTHTHFVANISNHLLVVSWNEKYSVVSGTFLDKKLEPTGVRVCL